DICFGPAMDSATVRAGKFLLGHLCLWPKFLFNRATGVSESRSRRTTHEQTLQIGASFRFRFPSRRFKIKSPGHFRDDKQCALSRYRKVTSPSSPDRLQSGE